MVIQPHQPQKNLPTFEIQYQFGSDNTEKIAFLSDDFAQTSQAVVVAQALGALNVKGSVPT